MLLLADLAGLQVGSIASGGRREAAGVKAGMVINRTNNVSLEGTFQMEAVVRTRVCWPRGSIIAILPLVTAVS